jgi:hypothetical protein
MTTTAQSVIRRAAETIQDLSAVRWSTAELVRYLNDGQREALMFRPDVFATSTTLTLVDGARQTLPSTAAKLLDVIRNAASASSRKAVRIVNRQLLDSQVPDWHIAPPAVSAIHYMYDPVNPREFYVYPPATVLTQLDVVVAQYPTAIAEPGSGTYTAVSGNIGMPDILANALTDYVIARAYMKDSEQAGNAGRAQAHYVLFTAALSTDFKGTSGTVISTAGAPARGASI